MDDNLPLRKVSLTCVESILEAMPERLDLTSIMTVLPLLLNDTDDIQLLSHQVHTEYKFFSSLLMISFFRSSQN